MKKAIVFNKVKKNFGKLEALKGIDLVIEEGEFFALLGPNGAGKSTLINILSRTRKTIFRFNQSYGAMTSFKTIKMREDRLVSCLKN